MRTLDSAFETQKNKKQNAPITLYEIQINSSTTIFIAERNVNTIFNGNTYLAFGIKRGNISQNKDGRIDQMTISISNVSLEMSSFIGNNDMRDNSIKILTVFEDTLATPTAKIEETFYIKSATVDENVAAFLVGTKLDIFELQIPRRTYNRTVCQWIYKDENCKFSGTFTGGDGADICDKSLDTKNGCRAHDNIINFGGFPDIHNPNMRIF